MEAKHHPLKIHAVIACLILSLSVAPFLWGLGAAISDQVFKPHFTSNINDLWRMQDGKGGRAVIDKEGKFICRINTRLSQTEPSFVTFRCDGGNIIEQLKENSIRFWKWIIFLLAFVSGDLLAMLFISIAFAFSFIYVPHKSRKNHYLCLTIAILLGITYLFYIPFNNAGKGDFLFKASRYFNSIVPALISLVSVAYFLMIAFSMTFMKIVKRLQK